MKNLAMSFEVLSSARPVLRRGARGSEVTELQQLLAAAGFSPGAVDGDFGPATERAVQAFQRARGLAVDGVVGPNTWNALLHAPSGGGSGPTLRRGSQGPEVSALQRRLNELGFPAGAVDGDFGPNTERAVRAFQSARGLAVDGIVGPQTWAALGVSAPGPAPSGGVSLQQLRAIMPNLAEARARECLPHLNRALVEAQIDNRMRRAAFLAQLAHESVELKHFVELASGEAYEGRADLGNTQRGDGRRYKGRGPIQLTGRNNYRQAGQALGIDLEGHPERAADLDVGFRVAGWYWTSRGLNPLADAGNFREITHKINGGYNGLAARERYYERAKQVL